MEKTTITLTKKECFELIEVLKSKIQWRLTEENNTGDLIKLLEKLIGCMTKEQQK